MSKFKLIIVFLITFAIGATGTYAYFEKIKPYLERKKFEKELSLELDKINTIPEEKFSVESRSDLSMKESTLKIIDESIPKLPRKDLFLQELENLEDLPKEKLLAVPFICQNPFRDAAGWKWHEESCEEAAVLQAVLYLQNKEMTRQEAHEYVLEMLAWQKKPENFGTHRDIYKEDLEMFTEKFFNLDEDEVFFFEDADEEFIKKVIAYGLPVVVPTVAKDLQNPYYRHPDYHMLTVIGYNEEKVITNDVGTRRGEKFPYTWGRLMKANEAAKGGGVLVIWPMKGEEKQSLDEDEVEELEGLEIS